MPRYVCHIRVEQQFDSEKPDAPLAVESVLVFHNREAPTSFASSFKSDERVLAARDALIDAANKLAKYE